MSEEDPSPEQSPYKPKNTAFGMSVRTLILYLCFSVILYGALRFCLPLFGVGAEYVHVIALAASSGAVLLHLFARIPKQ